MSITTTNMTPAVRAQLYSQFLLTQLEDGFLPSGWHRDVSDFTDGTAIQIPVYGDVVIRDYVEDQDVVFDPVSSGSVSLEINKYVQGGYYITDKMKQDSYIISQIDAETPRQIMRKISETYETNLLAQVNVGQTAASPNAFNGADKRFVAGGTNQVLTLDDIAYMKLAFDVAKVPEEGRVLILSPFAEAQFNKSVAAQAFTNNPMFEGMVTTGFSNSMRFIRSIFGFDIYVSNRLPQISSETINATNRGTNATATSASACIAMCVADDMCKPFMGAWRQMPRTEGERNIKKQRDEFVVTARWGFGVQRVDTLGAILVANRFA